VRALPYSISYISYAFLQENAQTTYVTITRGGNPVSVLDNDLILEAMDMVFIAAPERNEYKVNFTFTQIHLDKLNRGSIIPETLIINNSWPVCDFSYIYLNTNYKGILKTSYL